jgi:dolichol kinase
VHLVALLIPSLWFIIHERTVPGTKLLLSQGLLILVAVIFLTVDFLRLRIHRVKDVFVVLFGSMLRRREFSGLTGGSYLLVASTFSAFIFEPRVLIAATAFLALGDTMAAFVGLWVGRIRFWNKTVEGTLAGFASCIGVAYVTSILPYWSIPLGVGIIGAITASAVEALPIEVNDNVAVPIVSGLVMQVTLWLHVFGS